MNVYTLAAFFWVSIITLTGVVYIHSGSNWSFLILVLLGMTTFGEEAKAVRAHERTMAQLRIREKQLERK